MSQAVGAFDRNSVLEEESGSAVSWPAIIAGASVASALSLALLSLGAGIGLVSVSPWSSNNPSVVTFGVLAGVWFIAAQMFTSAAGGYLSGRLRTRWVGIHTHETFFRDTAHGLIVWAIGAIVSYGLLALSAAAVANGASHAGEAAIRSAGSAFSATQTQTTPQGAASTGNSSVTGYFTDMLFRTDHPAASQDARPSDAEALRILTHDIPSGDVSVGDKAYLAQLVASRTGLSQADAEKRVTEVVDQAKSAEAAATDAAKSAADVARKTGVYVALWAFVSLLVGAFAASYMATVGGRDRDQSSYPV